MTITAIGAVFAALFIACLVGGRSTFVYALAISLFFNDSAMFVIGDAIGVTPYAVALIIAAVLQVAFVLRSRRRHQQIVLDPFRADSRPGIWLRRSLLVLVVYGATISAVGPAVFSGYRVMPSQGSYDFLVDHLPGLQYTVSNVAQIVYLLLNAGLVWFISTLPRLPRRPFMVAVAITLAAVLASVIVRLTGLSWPFALFDNSPRNYYAVLADDPRLRAQFSEPSHLAWFLTMTLVYAACFVFRRPLWRALSAGAAIIVCLVAAVLDPASTIVLAIGVLLPASLVVLAVRHRRTLLTPRGLGITSAAIVAAALAVVVLWRPLLGLVGPALLGKIGGSSQYSRGKQDLNSLDLLIHSFGVGVGLGSNRSSSLATMLLSNVGVVGTVAYYAVIVLSVVVLMRRGSRPEAWALIALGVACAIAVADFVSPPTWFLVGIAVQSSRPRVRFGGAHRLPVAPVKLPQLVGAPR